MLSSFNQYISVTDSLCKVYKINTLSFYSIDLLIHFWSYQVLPRSSEYEKGLLGVHSSKLPTFIFIYMVTMASISFVTQTHIRTYARKPGKLTYRDGTDPPKNHVSSVLSLNKNRKFHL